MILLLGLLFGLLLIGLVAMLAAPLIAVLAVVAVPAIVGLAVIAAPALAIAALAGSFSTVNISMPVLATLEVLGIAVGMFGLVAALAYVANRLAVRTQVLALRPREIPIGAREQVIVKPQIQSAFSRTEQGLPPDLAAQCRDRQLAPCPV